MIRTGKVVSVENGSIRVCFDRLSACENCGMCGAGGRPETTVLIRGKALPGDIVDVEMPDSQVLKVSLVAYVIPLLGLIAGLWLGSAWMPGKDFAVLGFGLLGLVLGLAAVKIFDRRLGHKDQWQPKLIAVHSDDERMEQAPLSEKE